MKEKIKELFAKLPRAEQLELLRELNSGIAAENPIVRINELSQEMYGQNIQFDITNIGDKHTPEIKVELITPWGIFEAIGPNQRVAKSRTAESALKAAQTASAASLFDED
jgi:hypothetical protein